MAAFDETISFTVVHCCKCGIAFGMQDQYNRNRLEKKDTFYCPAGHGQHYTGPTEAEKLRRELARKDELLQAEQARARKTERSLAVVVKAHKSMRTRVMNGVCPCCNRSFGNLREHMKTQHPSYSSGETLRLLRQAFGMTQAALAEEVGVATPQISNYERQSAVISARAKRKLDAWVDELGGSPALSNPGIDA